MIPKEWTIVPFAEVAEYRAGRTPPRAKSEYWGNAEGNLSWVAISDMSEFGVVTDSKEKITYEAFNQVFSGRIVPSGTLLMSFKLTIGRIATLGIDACHNEAIISIYPRQGIDQRYLGYFLAQVNYDALQDRQVKGNTLNREKIDRIPISVPPVAEQSAIADILDQVKRSMDIQNKALSTMRELKHAAMQTLFTGGLRGEAQKETEIGPLPESWEWKPISEHFMVVSGGTPSRKVEKFWMEGTIPWVKTTEIDYCVIEETEECITKPGLEQSAAKILHPGTLLLAMYGQGATRGKVAILGIEAACNQACAAISANDGVIDSKYLYHFLVYRYESIRQLAHGGQQQNLNLEIVRNLPIAVPLDMQTQVEIVNILDAIDRKIDLHCRKRAVLEELFTALLHQLMTGETRVGNLDLSGIKVN